MVSLALFLTGLLTAAWQDARSRKIHDLSSLAVDRGGVLSFRPGHLPGLFLALPFLWADRAGRGGAGDTRLIAASGLFLGPLRGGVGLVLALTLFLSCYLAALLLRKIRKRPPPPENGPLAPFLAVGFLAAYFI